jgi:hypothetical protein
MLRPLKKRLPLVELAAATVIVGILGMLLLFK